MFLNSVHEFLLEDRLRSFLLKLLDHVVFHERRVVRNSKVLARASERKKADRLEFVTL